MFRMCGKERGGDKRFAIEGVGRKGDKKVKSAKEPKCIMKLGTKEDEVRKEVWMMKRAEK